MGQFSRSLDLYLTRTHYVGSVYSHNKKGNIMSARHFTISDADKSIREEVEKLRKHLEEKGGVFMSQAKVILWAAKRANRAMESK